MTDERDPSFFDDRTPHLRRHHPAVDRGHAVIRDSGGDEWSTGTQVDGIPLDADRQDYHANGNGRFGRKGRHNGHGPNGDGPPDNRGPFGVLPDASGDEPRRRSGRLYAGAVALLLVLVAGGAVAYQFVKGGGKPHAVGTGSSPVTVVVVKPGDSLTTIADTLYNDGVISSADEFLAAAAANPASTGVQPGSYSLHKNMSAAQALAALLARKADGTPLYAVIDKVTIPEGLVTTQVYALLHAKTGVPVADFVAAAKDPVALGVSPTWFAHGAGNRSAAKIEGFLFPDTYSFQPNESATDMLKTMVAEFNDTMNTLNFPATVTNTLHISPYAALVAASIAQAEAKFPADMGPVARVVYNRAYTSFNGNLLQLDSTINYWQKLRGKPGIVSKNLGAAMADKSDPYNTYVHAGLPPGPIGNPGKAALTGAMTAPKSADLFFVTIDPAGHMGFAKDLAGHQANIRLACKNGVTDLSC